MRYFFLFLLFTISFFTKAQLLNLGEEWFTENGFFNTEEIKKQRVKSITISKSEKKDGEFFKKEKALIDYYFYDNGFLKESLKFMPHSGEIDTSKFSFYYNTSGSLYKRIEKQGPFLFYYYYVYNKDGIAKELKIDGNSLTSDTAYIRFYENNINGNSITTTVLNSIKKPFKTITTETDLFNQVTSERINYHRSANFSETTFNYQLNQLNSKQKQSYFGREKKIDWHYKYKNGILDLVSVKENDKTVLKYGFTYDAKRKVKAIVERNLKEKTVSIYKFTYTN